MAGQPFKRVEQALAGGRKLMTTAKASARMSKVQQSGTFPERAVRIVTRQLGLRTTHANRDLPGSPDLANRSRRFAIFVHGCYWHRHLDCNRATTPKSNTAFWRAKFVRNMDRDRQSERALEERGFRVVTIWECEVGDTKLIARRLRGLNLRPSKRASSRPKRPHSPLN